jgi:transcription factor Dp-1
MKVCEKVESKQTTTYNEVADELVAEFSKPDDPKFCADQAYDEKNIRRRVYDALNVLMAMEIITKQKKEIMWKGLPATSGGDVAALRAEKKRARAEIEKKNAYLQELVEQYNSYQALLQRNAARTAAGLAPSGISLPFILVQTKPSATVEVEISEDQQVVHFDFNASPFQIHDGNFVLANMNLCMENLALRGEGNDGNGDDVGGEGMVRDALVLDASASASPAKNTSARGKKKEEKKGDEKKSAPAAKKAPVTAARTTRGVKGKR